MLQQTKIVNGKPITYSDELSHYTETHFSFWDRIKILFGRNSKVHSTIYYEADKYPIIKGSEATSTVDPLIKRKPKVYQLMQSGDTCNTAQN